MTKKDYVLIAKVLRSLGEDAAHCFDDATDRETIAIRFAQALKQDNAAFDAERFIDAAILEKDNA